MLTLKQMCEPRASLPFYAPCTLYKLNTEWTQRTDDRLVRAECTMASSRIPALCLFAGISFVAPQRLYRPAS
jgi:hypothetical protein